MTGFEMRMSIMNDFLRQRAVTANQEVGDYIKGGLLHCGKCHTPKQCFEDFSDAHDGSQMIACAISCRCEEIKLEHEREQKANAEFKEGMSRRLAMFPISATNYAACTFSVDDSPQSDISRKRRRYVENWDRIRAENIGILFTGTVGTGKSFYAAAIVNALLDKRIPAVVTTFPRLLQVMQGSKEPHKIVDALQEFDLLVIDDLGVERSTDYAAEQVYSVVDARVQSKLPLIVTTNMTIKELREAQSMQHKRIYDRLLDACVERCILAGESRRVGRAEQRRQIAREILGC